MNIFNCLPLPLQRLLTAAVALFLLIRFLVVHGTPEPLVRKLRDRFFWWKFRRVDPSYESWVHFYQLIRGIWLYIYNPPRCRIHHLVVLQAQVNTPPCSSCSALCCKRIGSRGFISVQILMSDLPGLLFVKPSSLFRLVPNIDRYLEFKLHVEEDSACAFLGVDNRCTIYAGRPKACRIFNCVDEWDYSRRRFGPTTGAHEFVDVYPELLKVFEHAGINPVPESKSKRRLYG